MSEASALKTAQQVLALAKRLAPKTEASVWLNEGRDQHLRFALNGVTTSGDVNATVLRLTLKACQRLVQASTSQVDAASLSGFVGRLVEALAVAPESPEAQPMLGPQKYAPSPYVFDEKTANAPYATLVEKAKQLIEPSAKAGLVSAGFCSLRSSVLVVATSAGLTASARGASMGLAVTSRTADGKGSGKESVTVRSLGAVDALTLGRQAAQTAQATARLKPLSPGRYTVVLESDAVSGLLGFLVGSLDERAAVEGRSAFAKEGGATRVGDMLAPEFVSIVSAPQSREAPGFSFDEEGLSLPRQGWIEQGKLVALSRSRFWAAKNKQQPTGGYPGYTLLPGTTTQSALVSSVKRGVLVKRIWYSNLVEPKSLLVTGLTRDGTFLIEDGTIVGAVNNFRLNESIVGMLQRCEGVASDGGLTEEPSTFTPAMKVADFTFSSVSDAV